MAAAMPENVMPGYFSFLENSYSCLQKYFSAEENNINLVHYPKGFYNDLVRYANISTNEIVATLATTVFLTVFRSILTKYLLMVSNLPVHKQNFVYDYSNC